MGCLLRHSGLLPALYSRVFGLFWVQSRGSKLALRSRSTLIPQGGHWGSWGWTGTSQLPFRAHLERRPSPPGKERINLITANGPRARCLGFRLLPEGAQGPPEPPKSNLRAIPTRIPRPNGSG